ncbi:penicillin-binding protein [Bdellovibrionales bacterium]|nr:penicillin-binding protein [Bdellovibrionales bacterium]
MKSRVILIFFGFLMFWFLLVGRTVYLQVLPNSKLTDLEKKQYSRKVVIESHRGSILDRNGKELAVTVATYSLFVDPKILKSPKLVARKLAKELGISYRQIYKKVKRSKRRFFWIKRHLSIETKSKIEGWKVRGLAFIEESKRIYPNESLLKESLGFVGAEGRGLEGIELLYNSELKGVRKEIKVQRDARGRPLVVDARNFLDQPDGKDIQLTIDSELQYYVERELDRVVAEHHAKGAVGVVLDAQTSEILALSNVSGEAASSLERAKNFRGRNRVVTDYFEPGSTIKPFIAAGAIREGLALPNTEYDCGGGTMKIGRRVIREADKKHSFDKLTLAEIIAHSSNVGITQVSFQLGESRTRKVLQDFGFGEKTGVDLPGEVSGVLHKLPWRRHQLSNISFGHAMAATALQIANAYGAIANGGVLRQPYIVKKIIGRSGEFEQKEGEPIRRVLTEEQSEMMRFILSGATSKGGTGYRARVPGFPVAGKTGTAQKVNPKGRGYIPGGYLSSFAGFVPVNNPRYVIFVLVDEPKGKYYGSTVAAPIFSSIAQYMIRKSGMAPLLLSNANVVHPEEKLAQKSGELIKKQAMQKRESYPIDGHRGLPNLLGMSLREALQRVASLGKRVKIRGRGRVVRTWPDPGDPIKNRKYIRLQLKIRQ